MVAQPTPALIHLRQHPQRISLPPATLDPWVEYWYESWHVFEVALHTVANCVCSSVGAGSPSYQPIGVCRVFTVIPSLLLQFRSLDRTPPPYMYYNIGSSLFHQHIKNRLLPRYHERVPVRNPTHAQAACIVQAEWKHSLTTVATSMSMPPSVSFSVFTAR